MHNLKHFFSAVFRSFRKSVKTIANKLSGLMLRSASYRITGVPWGLDRAAKPMIDLCDEGGIMYLSRALATRLGGNLTEAGKLITMHLQPIDRIAPEEHDLFYFSTRRFFPTIYHSSEPIATLAVGRSGAFYHWFFDVVARLYLIKKAGLSSVKLYVESLYPFQKESLALLEINESQIVNAATYDAIKAPHLFVPTIPTMPTSWGCQFLRDVFLPKLSQTKKRRVYISRSDASKRRIVNEKQVLDLLKKYCFEKVTLSSLTLKEQMELFYSAEMIAGPHGAGFTHLVFCDPQTSIIEIFTQPYVNKCYQMICEHLGLLYEAIFGTPIYTSSDHRDPDILVDIAELDTKIRTQISQAGLRAI